MSLTIRINEGMGYRPDLPDFRDQLFGTKLSVRELPRKAMVPRFDRIPVFNQLRTNSCVGNAVSSMMTYTRGVTPRSRLQIYYEARRLINETHNDEGCYIRDAIKVISNLGAGREDWWPFKPENVNVDPPLNVDRDGLMRKIFNYRRLNGGDDYKACIAEGFPLVLGFSVYNHFMGGHPQQYGIVTMPDPMMTLAGGHAICVIGYDMDFANSDWAKDAVAAGYPVHLIPERVYIVRNSWGREWGKGGDFAVDMRYFDDPRLSGDAWTIRKYRA